MGEKIASEAMTSTITPHGDWTPGTPTYMFQSTEKVKSGGNKVIHTGLTWTMSGCTRPSWAFQEGSGAMNSPMCQKATVEGGMVPYRETDTGLCSGTFVWIVWSRFCSCNFEITDGGSSASAE